MRSVKSISQSSQTLLTSSLSALQRKSASIMQFIGLAIRASRRKVLTQMNVRRFKVREGNRTRIEYHAPAWLSITAETIIELTRWALVLLVLRFVGKVWSDQVELRKAARLGYAAELLCAPEPSLHVDLLCTFADCGDAMTLATLREQEARERYRTSLCGLGGFYGPPENDLPPAAVYAKKEGPH